MFNPQNFYFKSIDVERRNYVEFQTKKTNSETTLHAENIYQFDEKQYVKSHKNVV